MSEVAKHNDPIPPQSPTPANAKPARRGQVVAISQFSARRRNAAKLHRSALEQMDAALECRGDSENVAREYEVRETAAVFEFSRRTRRELRQLQSQVRWLTARLTERVA